MIDWVPRICFFVYFNYVSKTHSGFHSSFLFVGGIEASMGMVIIIIVVIIVIIITVVNDYLTDHIIEDIFRIIVKFR